MEEWLKRLPAEPKAAPQAPAGTEIFQYRKVIGDALMAVRPAAEMKKVPVLTQMAGEFPNVLGNPQAAQSGLQTLFGWTIARSNRTPIDMVLFRLKGGEPSGPFAINNADKLPLGEWVVLSIVDSGPALDDRRTRRNPQTDRPNPDDFAAGVGQPPDSRRRRAALGGSQRGAGDDLRRLPGGGLSGERDNHGTRMPRDLVPTSVITQNYRVNGIGFGYGGRPDRPAQRPDR